MTDLSDLKTRAGKLLYRQLPEEYREPLLMQVIHGYSQKEIADHLGISVGGAGTRLFRAREKLRELLQ